MESSRNNRKKRQLGGKPVHFCCEHIGKYIGSSKRRITWRFGFTNVHAAGVGLGVEEHEVVLIWSVMSNKIKVFWNKTKISHLLREKRTAGKVHVSWESRSGEKFQILAHESKSEKKTKSSSNTSQYDLLVDGVSLFSFVHVSALNPSVVVIDDDAACSEVSEVLSETSEEDSSSSGSDEGQTSCGFRLSMAGFKPSCYLLDEIVDDLTSPSLTNTLESLRPVVTSLIPNSRDMVSKAIINAFLEDNALIPSSLEMNWLGCSSSSSSTISSMVQTDTQIEADTLYDTTEWMNLNVQCTPLPDVEEQKRVFLQKQMDIIFKHARYERLTENAATRILLNVATLLDVPISSSIQRDTLMISDLKEIDVQTLTETMMIHEEFHEVGVTSNRRFAFCRFASERGPLRALAAADNGKLLINGKRPQLSLIQKPSLSSDRRRTISAPYQISDQVATTNCKPILTTRKSHQRNIISIDTLICESPPFLRLVNDVVL
mmetsp:Transcript_104/g.118  ORF Transcript_104/g.118 Transcript_104/m.118 type:complete len:489 (-) Transcript_104:220-1686(-)